MNTVSILVFDNGVEVFSPQRPPTKEQYTRCIKYFSVPQQLWELAYATGYNDGKRQAEVVFEATD